MQGKLSVSLKFFQNKNVVLFCFALSGEKHNCAQVHTGRLAGVCRGNPQVTGAKRAQPWAEGGEGNREAWSLRTSAAT